MIDYKTIKDVHTKNRTLVITNNPFNLIIGYSLLDNIDPISNCTSVPMYGPSTYGVQEVHLIADRSILNPDNVDDFPNTEQFTELYHNLFYMASFNPNILKSYIPDDSIVDWCSLNESLGLNIPKEHPIRKFRTLDILFDHIISSGAVFVNKTVVFELIYNLNTPISADNNGFMDKVLYVIRLTDNNTIKTEWFDNFGIPDGDNKPNGAGDLIRMEVQAGINTAKLDECVKLIFDTPCFGNTSGYGTSGLNTSGSKTSGLNTSAGDFDFNTNGLADLDFPYMPTDCFNPDAFITKLFDAINSSEKFKGDSYGEDTCSDDQDFFV